MLERLKGEFSRLQGQDVLRSGRASKPPVRLKRTGTLALAGAGAGAAAGAGAGYLMAQQAISRVPRESVTLEWEVPRTERAEIGRIPGDRYEWLWGWGWHDREVYYDPENPGAGYSRPVLSDLPVLDSQGSPVLGRVERTFTGHGKPVVEWRQKPIEYPELKGYRERILPDTHTHFETDADGDTHRWQHTHGYWIRYSPIVQHRVVGRYRIPEVRFDHGVDTLGYVLKGLLIGAGLGAIGGGLIGAIQDRYRS